MRLTPRRRGRRQGVPGRAGNEGEGPEAETIELEQDCGIRRK